MTKIQKHHVGVLVEKNAFVDDGEGVITFPNRLTITDGSTQRNGTQYDIETLDISEYKGQITADHVDMLQNIIARAEDVKKDKNKVTVGRIVYAVKENPLARLAYNLLVSGFSTDFSIETYGPWPGDEGVYMNAKLIGLSQVVVGNNKSASVNAIVKNSLEQSKEDGLDTAEVEAALEKELETSVSANHTAEPAESEEDEKAKQEAADAEAAKKAEEEEAERLAEEAKEQEEADKKAREEAAAEEARKAEEEAAKAEEEAELAKSAEDKEKTEQNNKNKEKDEMTFVTIKNSRDFPITVTYKNAAGDDVEAVLEAGKTVDVAEEQKEAVEAQITGAEAPKVDNAAEIEKAVNAARDEMKSEFAAQFAELKEAFSKGAEEPGFKPADKKDTKTENAYSELGYKERHAKQINAAWEYLKLGRIEAAKVLNDVNEVNLEALKTEGKVENQMTISDFGNFVISPELLTEIQGFRNDYTALIDATDWRETLSLEFAWLRRQGDIDMQSVELEPGEDGDGNLKPISEYTAEPVVSKLEELAAVTPVCNSATRFLAVDLLGDVARGYRTDYDRKRAQLVVARMQQAVDANGNQTAYTANPGDATSLTSWVQLWAEVSEVTINGVYVFNTATYSIIQKAAVDAGANGPLASIFLTGEVPTIFGRRFVVVPNDLMPTLNSGETRTHTVDGAPVTIDNAVFYLDMNNFTGRTSGGLQYDLSTEAAYEVNGVVKSAYQRNELVLRGSFFRGGAILDESRVAGMSSDVAVVAS